MTKAAELIGFPSLTQNQLGFNNVAITAAGTTSTDATVCDPQNDVFVMTATGSDGIRFNSATPLLTPIIVVNTSGSTGKVYPHTGGNWNGGSADAALSILTVKAAFVMRVTSTLWLLINSG